MWMIFMDNKCLYDTILEDLYMKQP